MRSFAPTSMTTFDLAGERGEIPPRELEDGKGQYIKMFKTVAGPLDEHMIPREALSLDLPCVIIVASKSQEQGLSTYSALILPVHQIRKLEATSRELFSRIQNLVTLLFQHPLPYSSNFFPHRFTSRAQ